MYIMSSLLSRCELAASLSCQWGVKESGIKIYISTLQPLPCGTDSVVRCHRIGWKALIHSLGTFFPLISVRYALFSPGSYISY